MTVATADVARLREAQAGVRTLVLADLTDFWAAQDFAVPAATRDALVGYSQDVVSRYGRDVGELTAQWYDEARAAERVPGRFAARAEPSPYLGTATEQTARRAAGGLWTGDLDGVLTTLRAVLPWYVTAAAQETVIMASGADPQAPGWQRVTRPGACKFCVALRDRGGVYQKATVGFAAHHSCGCAAVPSWDPHARPVTVEAYRASPRTGQYASTTRSRLLRRGYTNEQIDARWQAAQERRRAAARAWVAGL